jgi:hypothetical protein
MIVEGPAPLLAYSKAGIARLDGDYGGREWLSGHDSCPYCWSALVDLGSFHAPANNLVMADDPDHGPAFCLRCGSRRAEPDEREPKRTEGGYIYYRPLKVTHGACLFRVAICEICGWWLAVEDADQCNNGYANGVCGILESFDPRSASVPLEVLSEELPRQLDRIHDVHPRRMQELIGAVLSGVYACEVHQVGFSRDGGIDLLLLTSDKPIAVQVKRRQSATRAEAVSGVREFIGAALLGGHRDVMFVTTAPRFSADAIAAADSAVEGQLVRSFDLIARSELSALLRTVAKHNNWQGAIAAARKDVKGALYIPDPFGLANADADHK